MVNVAYRQAGETPLHRSFTGIDGLRGRDDLQVDEHAEDVGDRIDVDDLVTFELDP